MLYCICLGSCCFGLETRVVIKISTNPCYTILTLTDFSWGWSKKKLPKWPPQKNWVFQFPQFSIFFSKISWIGPWVSTIFWCEGHWCGSTYMAVRLSNISSKTGKECIFCVFRQFFSLCRIPSWQYRLSHINALRIIQPY